MVSLFKPPLGSSAPAPSLRPAHPPAAVHDPAASHLATTRTSRATSVPAAALPSPAHCLSHAADLIWAQDRSSEDHMLRTQSNPLMGSAGGAGPLIRDSADLEKFWCAHYLLLQSKHRQRGLCSALHARQHRLHCLLQHLAPWNSASQAASHMRNRNASSAGDTLAGYHPAFCPGPCNLLAKAACSMLSRAAKQRLCVLCMDGNTPLTSPYDSLGPCAGRTQSTVLSSRQHRWQRAL